MLGSTYSNNGKLIAQAGNRHVLFGELIKPVLIPVYAVSKREPVIFKSWDKRYTDFYASDVVVGATATPIFFPAITIYNMNKSKRYTLIDGGIYANNPALIALRYAMKLYPSKKYILVSIGTGMHILKLTLKDVKDWGEVSWAIDLVGLIIDSSSMDIHNLLILIASYKYNDELYYFRYNIKISSQHQGLSNVSQKNFNALRKYGKEIVVNNKQELDLLIEALKKDSVKNLKLVK